MLSLRSMFPWILHIKTLLHYFGPHIYIFKERERGLDFLYRKVVVGHYGPLRKFTIVAASA